MKKFLLSLFLFSTFFGVGNFAIASELEEEIEARGALPPLWDTTLKPDEEFGTPQLIRLPHRVDENKISAVEMIKNLFWKNVLPLFKYIFIGISLIFFTSNIFMINSNFGDQSQVQKYRAGILWGILGFGIISIAAEVADIFDPIQNKGNDLMDLAGAENVQKKFIGYLQMALSIVSSGVILYSGGQLITAGGKQDVIEKSKKFFGWGFAGLVLAIIARPIVEEIFYPAHGAPGAAEIVEFTAQIISIAKFLLALCAAIAFGTFIISGFLYLTSFGNEERNGQAKKILFGSIVGILVILISFVFVAAFVPGSENSLGN